MTRESLDETTRSTRQIHEVLTVLAWIMFAVLVVNVSYLVGEEVGQQWYENLSLLPMLGAWGIGMIKAMPTLLIAFAIADFALLFGRCSEGDVFTERNVKTLKNGADSLLGAAAWSAFVSPLLLNWIGDGERGGWTTSLTDLALAVGAMGLCLHGLALVFRDAVHIKQDSDEII